MIITPCIGSDPTCPCQDGDICHYEGDDPMEIPSTWEERMARKARMRRDIRLMDEELKDFLQEAVDVGVCDTCHNGRRCNCQIYFELNGPPDQPFACACLGFINCPTCERTRTW